MDSRKVDASFDADFNMSTLSAWVNKHCPTITTLLERIIIIECQRKTEAKAAERAAAGAQSAPEGVSVDGASYSSGRAAANHESG